LYAFWPELVVKMNDNDNNNTNNNDDDNDDDEDQSENQCSVRLVWPTKCKVNKTFREPYTFKPNINSL
jgi:hypothetical protein